MKSFAALWQLFTLEVLITILCSPGLYLARDSRVISFCSAGWLQLYTGWLV